jgi:hypothetical protein
MPKLTHYDDDLYFLLLILRALRQGLDLTLDPGRMAEYYYQSLFFVDKSLHELQASLMEQSRLIERPKHLKNLVIAWNRLIDTLEAMRGESNPIIAALGHLSARLEEMRQRARESLAQAMSALSSSEEDVDEQDLVGTDELFRLMQTNEEA